MFAVIRTGGKQYRVAKNDVITVEKLAGDEGAKLEFGDVLAVGDSKATKFGTPLVEGASVAATVLEQTRGDKIIVFKKKRRHNYRRRKGHRQDLTVLRITDIFADGKKAAAKTAAKTEAKTEAKAKPKTAPKTEAKAKPKAKPAAKKPAAKPKAEAKAKPAAARPAAKPKAKPKAKPEAKPKEK
ncbi:MAG: 50S ribosomal protein L21 [Alphaproteobacteria bacterium]